RQAGVLEPPTIEVRRPAVDPRRPDDLRHCVRELPVARLARTLELCELLLVQEVGLLPELPVLRPELDEDRDLRAQDARVYRLEDVVDGAGRVAAVDVGVLFGES